ncbi:hypothetical protein VIGAN_04357700, partial [Vigna angularis var. angularis]
HPTTTLCFLFIIFLSLQITRRQKAVYGQPFDVKVHFLNLPNLFHECPGMCLGPPTKPEQGHPSLATVCYLNAIHASVVL